MRRSGSPASWVGPTFFRPTRAVSLHVTRTPLLDSCRVSGAVYKTKSIDGQELQSRMFHIRMALLLRNLEWDADDARSRISRRVSCHNSRQYSRKIEHTVHKTTS